MARRANRRRVAPCPTHGDPGDAALVRAAEGTTARLDRRGVLLSGRETGEQLVGLLDSVEQFELTAERAGADLFVDEPVRGARTPIAPDDPAFVLPVRGANESADDFVARITDSTVRAERVHRRAQSRDRAR